MNSDKTDDEQLPDGWVLCKSKSNPGRKYYFNRKTGKSSWTKPQAEENPKVEKQMSKKEKLRREKSKKEEQRKVLKRKSDSKDDLASNKKQKTETPLVDKRTPGPSKTQTPVKCPEPSKKESPLKPSPSKHPKNLANARLSKLRARLSSEMSKSDEEKSPVKSKPKVTPKTPQSETKKLDLKSPNVNESKSSTTQSPGSDSHQSIPSPSQFLAANKIISSMKAQLPDEYTNKLKPKDTFADIEEGISKQTPEFPSTKHPSTPPQFSEASKLVSAIKSKLSYKISPKDGTVRQFSSAKDRMEALRSSMGNDNTNETVTNTRTVVTNSFLSKQELSRSIEAMEVEESREREETLQDKQNVYTAPTVTDDIVLVVDTNIFIHELDVIKNVINSHIKGYNKQPTLLVPWRVINELDRLKDNNNGTGAICKRARAAMDYLYKSLPETDRIKGQSLRDANSHIYPCELPDDEILNCCLQQAERGKSVILLSNDKNLCNKAVTNGVKSIGLDKLKPLLENKPQPVADPDMYASVQHYKSTMYSLLANILENEMRAKYNNLWQRVVFKPPPWTLGDVLQCLLKHWMAVFGEVFPRIEHLIADANNALLAIESKDPKSLSQSEVSNFKELCLEIAKKCQIIPEYMELAKATVERLLRKREETPIIDAFEGLWTVFSSYCAKLATSLKIPHEVEDKLPSNDSLADLTRKFPEFSKQIIALTTAMNGTLSMDPSEPRFEEQVFRLEGAFARSAALAGRDAVGRDSVRGFCTGRRNMLQEACSKFTELTQLLSVCENHLTNE